MEELKCEDDRSSGSGRLPYPTTTIATATTKPTMNHLGRPLHNHNHRSTTYHTKKQQQPIASYGVIVVAKSTGKFLVSQRRDTIEYTEFLRGRVHKNLHRVYFACMTQIERDRLLNYTFIQLWDDLWVNHANRFYREAYAGAKAKFQELRPKLPELLATFPSSVTEPSWGFPKGKLNYATEKHEHAAIREFTEETGLALSYKNLLDVPSVTEQFHGTNGKLYSTTYLIALVPDELAIERKAANCMRPNTVSSEIADLRWVTVEDSKKLLTERRWQLLESVRDKISAHLN